MHDEDEDFRRRRHAARLYRLIGPKLTELYQNNALANAVFTAAAIRGDSREHTLETLALAFAEQNATLFAELSKIHRDGLPPIVLQVTEQRAEELRANRGG